MRKHYVLLFLAFVMGFGLFAYPVFAQTMENKSGDATTSAADACFTDGYKQGFTAGLEQARNEIDKTGAVRGYREESGSAAGSEEAVKDDRSDLQRFYDANETTGGKWD